MEVCRRTALLGFSSAALDCGYPSRVVTLESNLPVFRHSAFATFSPSYLYFLIGALVAPWRVGGVPAPRGGPIGRPGEWIWPARSPYTTRRGSALLG
jgi:hypothetical protein